MIWILASQFARHGHEIVAITSDTLRPKERAGKVTEELSPRIMLYRFCNTHTALAARLPIIFNRPNKMREERPAFVRSADVVHMGESRGIVQFWTANACRRAQVPLVWSAYGGLGTAPGIRGQYRRLNDDLSGVPQRVRSHAFLAEHAPRFVALLRGWNARQLVSVGVGRLCLITSLSRQLRMSCCGVAISRRTPSSGFEACFRRATSVGPRSRDHEAERNELDWKEVFRRTEGTPRDSDPPHPDGGGATNRRRAG